MPSALENDVLTPSPSQRRQLAILALGFVAAVTLVVSLWPSEVFSKSYLPHIYCYLDKPGLIWTHVGADSAIALSYFAISTTLAYLVYRGRREIPFRWMFLAFGLFIIACGATHLVEIITVWVPIYVFSAGVKIFTAVASLATAVVLPTQVPRVLALIRQARESGEYRRAIEQALHERDEAHTALEMSNRRLEQQVEERNRQLYQLASIVESSNDAIISKDLRGLITTWNPGAERLYGYKAEEMVGQSVARNIPEDHLQEFREIMTKVARGERVDVLHTKRITKSGKVLDVALTVSPITNSSGNIIGASAIGRDITPLKWAEHALRRSEEQYRILFDRNPLPMWVFDLKSLAFLAVNEAAMRHYGYSREEFLQLTILDIRPAEDIPQLLQEMAHPLPGLQDTRVWRHRKKDGTLIHVEITAHELNFAGHAAELVLANDITDRIRSEEELHQAQERFSKAFRSSPFGISISTESEGRYIDVNPAFLNMMGYRSEEVIGQTASDLNVWAEPQQRLEMLQQLNTSNAVKQIEAKFRTRSGDVKQVQLAAERITLNHEKCILAIMQDVTDTRRMEQQFRQAQKMEAIGRLTGGIAHDFNNMLGVIIGYSEIAQDKLGSLHPARQHIDQIKLAGDRAATLTRQLLAFSRQQVIEPKIIDLNTAIKNVLKMLRRMIGENIELIVKPAEPLGNVKVDVGQLEQVLMNLTVNARDAMPNGGTIVIETADVELDEIYAQGHQTVVPGSYVMLSVSDTGTGIAPEAISQIFEPFFTTKKPEEGTGLGLSTVYGIVKQSGGYIWVYSELGKGTTFKIYLPRVAEPVQSLGTHPAALAPHGSETLLVVEDDPTLRMLTVELLQGSGYTILQAEGASSALELARRYQGTIDLLLSDVIMPGSSGPELASELLKIRPQIRILFISGYTGEFVNHRGGMTVNAPLLSKPFSRSTLLNKLRSVLEEKPRDNS